jgi:hypothetical protein
MNARELLKLNEQVIAVTVMMRGGLAKEVEDAKAALDALGTAEAILAAKAINEADTATFEAYKVRVEVAFDKANTALDAKETDYTDRVSALSVGEQALRINQGVLSAGQADLASKQVAYIAQAQVDQAALVAARAEIDSEKTALDAAFAGVAARELAVSQKLAAMKAIV